jgi:hypothetical protein
MQRIHSAGASPDYLFTEGNPALRILPTRMNSNWLNSVQEELAGTIEHAGIALDQIQKTDHTQLLQAIDHIRQVNLVRIHFDLPPLCFHQPRDTGLILDSNRTRAAHLQGVFIYATQHSPHSVPLEETFYFCEREARWNPPQFYNLDFEPIPHSRRWAIVLSISHAGHVQYLKPSEPGAGTFIITDFKEYAR